MKKIGMVGVAIMIIGVIILLWPTFSQFREDAKIKAQLEQPLADWTSEAEASSSEDATLVPSLKVQGSNQSEVSSKNTAAAAEAGTEQQAAQSAVNEAVGEQQAESAADGSEGVDGDVQTDEANLDSQNDLENRIETDRQSASTSSPRESPPTVAVIQIDQINLRLPVVEGTTNELLRYAAGHISGTALPGEIGNAAIAAHNSESYGRYFNRLDELGAGDKIRIETKNGAFVYQVTDTKIVPENDLSVLQENSKQRLLTLITCDDDNTYRLIVKAELIEQ